jgi:hypothetical protein
VVGDPVESGALITAIPSGGVVLPAALPVHVHAASALSQVHVAGAVVNVEKRASRGSPLLLKMSAPEGQLVEVQQEPALKLPLH